MHYKLQRDGWCDACVLVQAGLNMQRVNMQRVNTQRVNTQRVSMPWNVNAAGVRCRVQTNQATACSCVYGAVSNGRPAWDIGTVMTVSTHLGSWHAHGNHAWSHLAHYRASLAGLCSGPHLSTPAFHSSGLERVGVDATSRRSWLARFGEGGSVSMLACLRMRAIAHSPPHPCPCLHAGARLRGGWAVELLAHPSADMVAWTGPEPPG